MENEKLCISATQQKIARSVARVPWTCSLDNLLHFGDKIMIHNAKINGFLVLDTGDRLTSTTEEIYAVTTNNKDPGPIARSVFIITRADPKDGFTDNIVHYGQKIRIQTNPYIFDKIVFPPS